MMKLVYSVAVGIGAFFALNCGSGETGYPEPSSSRGTTTTQQPEQNAPKQDTAQSSSATSPANGVEVKVIGHEFEPQEVHIKAGQTVKWVWVSGNHNVVSGAACESDGKFSSGETNSAPRTFEHTFEEEGTFPYFCDPHCGFGMTGKVIVD